MSEAANDKMVGQLMQILPENIIPESNSRWNGLKDSPVNDLLQSIPVNGQMSPVNGWLDSEGRFHLEFGYRRLKAISIINEGKKTEDKLRVLCLITPKTDALTHLVRNIEENVGREEVSPMDRAYGCQILRDKHKVTQKRMAEIYHVSPAQITQYLYLLECVPEIQALVHVGIITMNEAKELRLLTPKQQREAAAEKAKEAGTTVELAKSARRKKGGKGRKKDKSALRAAKIIYSAVDILIEKQYGGKVVTGCLNDVKKFMTSKETLHDFITRLCPPDTDQSTEE